MSILIKGMAMPGSCWDCEVFGCSLKDRLKHIEDRNPDCPLIEIPTPHGRLIDANKLADNIATMLERNNKLIDLWLANLIQDEIDDAPTILEAEE